MRNQLLLFFSFLLIAISPLFSQNISSTLLIAMPHTTVKTTEAALNIPKKNTILKSLVKPQGENPTLTIVKMLCVKVLKQASSSKNQFPLFLLAYALLMGLFIVEKKIPGLGVKIFTYSLGVILAALVLIGLAMIIFFSVPIYGEYFEWLENGRPGA